MRGKSKCKILKEIRQKIADENDIPYVTRECTYQGECSGTCPKCEAELRYLEQQLEKRQRLGKRITVAALAASLMTGLVGCPEGVSSPRSSELAGDVPYSDPQDSSNCELNTEQAEVKGEVEYVPETEEVVEIAGIMPETEETSELSEVIGEVTAEPVELDGDVDYIAGGIEPFTEEIAGIVELFTEENDG